MDFNEIFSGIMMKKVCFDVTGVKYTHRVEILAEIEVFSSRQ
jgi:hypothetical protein